MTLLILTSILVVALGAASLVFSGIKMSGTQAVSTKAYFAAEAGAERILWEVRKNMFDISECAGFCVDFTTPTCVDCNTIFFESLSNGSGYKVKNEEACDLDVCFTSTGQFINVKRTVEIEYCFQGSINPDCQ